jgi:hypothetical protein
MSKPMLDVEIATLHGRRPRHDRIPGYLMVAFGTVVMVVVVGLETSAIRLIAWATLWVGWNIIWCSVLIIWSQNDYVVTRRKVPDAGTNTRP